MNIEDIKLLIESCQRGMDLDERVGLINDLREFIHDISPFKDEPVDFVRWVKNDTVIANDYNPNSVAPPEMKLLEHSIDMDGYTQPIVSFNRGDCIEVVDGFHRHRVGKESEIVNARVQGYLPVVSIKGSQSGRSDRMASTVRHNRARGKHSVNAMSDMVIELKKRNWTDKRIGKELGMDEDEVLRLCQISGLVEVFADESFSMSWDVDVFDEDSDMDLIDDE